MSRVGKKIIKIPSGVEISMDGKVIKTKGSKGELEMKAGFDVEVKLDNEAKEIQVEKKGRTKQSLAMWGTTRALINNMIIGVSEGFKKQLELEGVGYKMAVSGKKLNMSLGFSHPVEMEIPEGVNVSIEKNVLSIEGADRQKVGQFAAEVRSKKKVEPYKGKGFRYVGELVIRKEGKKTAGN